MLLLAALAFFLWSASLFLRQAVRWAGAHPGTAVAAAVAVAALAVVLVRCMPSVRELRRAARAGAAEADAEAAGAAAPDVADMADMAEAVEAAKVADVAVAERPPVRADVLEQLDADEFEQTVARLCERDGCRDVRVVGGAGDLGADVLAYAPDGRLVVVQCKRYGPEHKVGSQDLQRFGGTCFTVHGADVAVLVTTSTFTEPAAGYAGTAGIRCCDGSALAGWFEGTSPAPWLWAGDDTAGAGGGVRSAPAV